jgi:hypothetical protein
MWIANLTASIAINRSSISVGTTSLRKTRKKLQKTTLKNIKTVVLLRSTIRKKYNFRIVKAELLMSWLAVFLKNVTKLP